MFSLFPSLFWRRLPLPWWALFRLGFGFVVVGWLLALRLRGSFLLRPPRKRRHEFWSLKQVLGLLRSPMFLASTSSLDLLRIALILVALASGLRSSQFFALVRHPSWLVFSSDGRQVSLAPSPGFLAKNERLGHSVSPCLLRAWLVGSDYHPLCPVGALKDYVRATSRRSPSRLFVWPDSLLPLSRRTSPSCCVPSLRRPILVLPLKVMM